MNAPTDSNSAASPGSAASIRPLGSQILAAPMPSEEKVGLIFLSQRHLEEQRVYEVFAVGPGRRVFNKKTRQWVVVPVEIAPGQRILIDQYRIKARTEAGLLPDGRQLFLFDSDSVAMVIP